VDGAWPVATLVGNRSELRLTVDRPIAALGWVQPDRSVDVFATAALPHAARITEVDLDARVGAQLCMFASCT
jgi:hypothetical protein